MSPARFISNARFNRQEVKLYQGRIIQLARIRSTSDICATITQIWTDCRQVKGRSFRVFGQDEWGVCVKA